MMPWPLHCKIREEPIHQNKIFKDCIFKKSDDSLTLFGGQRKNIMYVFHWSLEIPYLARALAQSKHKVSRL